MLWTILGFVQDRLGVSLPALFFAVYLAAVDLTFLDEGYVVYQVL